MLKTHSDIYIPIYGQKEEEEEEAKNQVFIFDLKF